ncbi:MAG: YbbR domain-containing protein [bacterium]|jgi:YbbR domain-containing protein
MLKKLLFTNLPQKFLALGLSLFIWIIAELPKRTQQNNVPVFISIPISYVNLPRNLVITSDLFHSTNISFEISQDKVAKIHPSLFQAIVDLKDLSSGVHTYTITRKSIKSPDQVNILNISPSKIKLTVEETIQKKLPIRATVLGTPAKGYVLEEIITLPDTILIRGRTSAVKQIQFISTKPINVKGLNSNVDILTELSLPSGIKFLEKEKLFQGKITAKIKVSSEPMTLRLNDVPIGLINKQFITKINPSKFNILLRGPKSLLQNFSQENLHAFIDLAKYKPGTYKIRKPTLQLPAAIQVQQVWPPINVWILNQKK